MKPIILTFTAFYMPGYRGGGPVRTIANMVARLGNEFDFRIITMDRDLGDQHAYDTIQVDAWNQVGQAQVYYASPAWCSLWRFARLMRETRHDVVYLNSFFDPKFTLTVLLARKLGLVPDTPTILAPRGEFSAGALKIKRWKKAPFTLLVRWLGIFDNIFWHASTPFESADIERVVQVDRALINLARNVAVAPDLLDRIAPLATTYAAEPGNKGVLSICFLSRIAPMKNLDFALKLLALVKAPVQFHIYGPKELRGYWADCEALIRQLPLHVEVLYCGSVENSQVRATIAKHDLFFVPSRGENFGHVFIEALSAGVPILVSDKTPWRDLEAQQLGWDIPLDRPDEFVLAIETAAVLNSDTRALMRERCIGFAQKQAEDADGLEMNRNLFINAIGLKKFNQDLH